MTYAHDFLSKFRDGVASSNRYRVEFFLPRGVNLGGGQLGVNDDARVGQITTMQNYFNAKEQVNVKCHTASFPERNLETYEYRQNSAPFRLPFSSSYNPVSFTFMADGRFDTRDFFEVWQSAVINISTNTLNFPDEYVSDVSIMALTRDGRDAYGVKLFEAWPVTIGETSLSYSDADTLAAVTVGMEYKYWSPIFNTQGKNGSSS